MITVRAWASLLPCVLVLVLSGANAHLLAQADRVSVSGLTRSGRDGAPLAGVQIRLPELNAVTTSDAHGIFAFSSLPAGRWRLQLRRIAFAPLDTILRLSDSSFVRVEFTLRMLPQELSPVNVAAAGNVMGTIAEFEARRARGTGVFLTREQLRANDERELADVLRSRVPGLAFQVTATGVHAYTRSQQPPGALNRRSRNVGKPCYTQIVLDGMALYQMDDGTGAPVDPPDMSEYLTQSLDGVEYYSSPSRTPPEFRTTGATCGTLVLWSRRR